MKFLYCTRHTLHFGDDTVAMLRECADVLAHVHVADTFNHKASSGLRYIINPPGTTARVHQHVDIGQGEVPWDDFVRTLAEIGFDGIMPACVFAWEEKADASGTLMRREMQRYVDQYWGMTSPRGPPPCHRSVVWFEVTAAGAAPTPAGSPFGKKSAGPRSTSASPGRWTPSAGMRNARQIRGAQAPAAKLNESGAMAGWS